MKVVCDIDVPFLKGVLEPYGEVIYKKGPEITSDDVRDADALILRTRTRCNAELLDGSSVRLIATATIGNIIFNLLRVLWFILKNSFFMHNAQIQYIL